MFSILSTIFAIGLVAYFVFEQRRHHAKIHSIRYRIHVNGTRGKSSVTRLVAGVLREAGIKTLGKTTGSDTNIITDKGKDLRIERRGPADIFENARVIANHVDESTEAIVFECMAIQPRFQRFLEEKVMKSNIGIITNVREDHVEEMGYSIEEIAHSLSSTIPANGYLICADENKKIQELLRKYCQKKNTKFINALDFKVADSYMDNFGYLEHKENVAIGLAIAHILNIPQKTALQGMTHVIPDMGAVFIKKYKVSSKKIIWINLFAANDRESVIKCVHKSSDKFNYLKPVTVGLLNNRSDRPERAKQFCDIVTKDLTFNYVATIGDLQKQVVNNLKRNNFSNIIPMANYKQPGKELLQLMLKDIPEDKILLFGMGNIHTHQAELILEYFSNKNVVN